MYNTGYYDYGYTTTVEDTSSVMGIFAGMTLIISLISIAISIISIVSMWKIFKKAGKNGWEAIIPIYNIIVLLQIVELPTWYIVLFLLPFANIYAMFKMYIELAHKFGKSTGFGVGLVLLNCIFMPMLAFGNNTYQGSNSQANYSSQQAMNNNQQNGYYQPQMQQAPQQNGYYQPQMQQMPQQNVNPTPVQNMAQPVENNTMQNGPMPSMNQNVNMQPNVNFQQPAQQNQNAKFCPNCGNKVEASSNACFMCGHKF